MPKLSHPADRRISRRATLVALAGSLGLPRGARAQAARRTARTSFGSVEVPPEPRRTVVLDAVLAGGLLALGAPVAALDVRYPGSRLNRRTGFPPILSAAAVAQGSAALPAADALDLEPVRRAAPDLVIGLATPRNRGALGALRAIAPTVLVPEATAGWRQRLDDLAALANREAAVGTLVGALANRVAELKGRLVPPDGEIDLLQANAGGIHETPFALPAGGPVGALLTELGLAVGDAPARLPSARPDSAGRTPVPFELVPEIFTAPNLIMVANGSVTMGQLCCDPHYRQLASVGAYRRWELDEAGVQPDYPSVLRLLDQVEEHFAKKS